MPDRSVSGEEAKMGIKIIPVDDNDAIAGLNRIFDDLQTRFHDEWDWMNAGFYVEILRCTIEDLREQQSASPEPNYKEPEMPPVKGMCMCNHPAATHRDDGRERYCVIIGCGCECFWPTPIPSPAQGQEAKR